MSEAGKIETWAIVELMGHQKLAGFVREVPLGTAAMLRVDVPEVEAVDSYTYRAEGGTTPNTRKIPAFTRFVAPAALYAMTPCTEEVARKAAMRFAYCPVYLFDQPMAPAAPQLGYEPPDESDVDDGMCDVCGRAEARCNCM